MTDKQRQQKHPPPQLEYPQILLDVSLESLLSHSNASTMTSSALEPNIEPDNLLSESWATLSNSDYSREDDLRSETTDVGSLVSNSGAEDVNSIEDESESEDDEDQPSNVYDHGLQQISNTLSQQLPPASTYSTHEDTTILEDDGLNILEFMEPRMDDWPEAGQIDVKRTIRMFNEAETHAILGDVDSGTNPTQLVGTVRMSMSRNNLELDRPFRVFYVGSPTARGDILGKIADALVAGEDPDSGHRDVECLRYHILPQHYGPGAPTGGADLIPIQRTQLHVAQIRSAFYKDEQESEIEISLENGVQCSSRLNSSNYEITSTTQSSVPDLALFYTSNDESPILRQTLHCTHKFMERHHIPSMIISGGVSWTSSSNTLPLKLQSLHICVESQASETQESRILRRLPVDLNTFEKLDLKQLNKNLACLIDPALLFTPATFIRTAPPARSDAVTSKSGDVEKNLSKSAILGRMPSYDYKSVIRHILAVALTLVVCSLCYTACTTTILMASSYISGHRDLVAPSVDLMSATSPVGVVETSVGLTSTPVPTVDVSLPTSLATVAPGDSRSSLSLPHDELLVNRLDRFQVQVIGDCHMIIKAPTKLKVKRRDPSFKVSVTKGAKLLDNLSLSKLFDGVYTVQIDRGDAYGLLNVTITMAKAGITEVHEVDFGRPWLKAARWKEAASRAQQEIGTAQELAFTLAQHLPTIIESQLHYLANFTSSVRTLYGGVTQQTEVVLRNAQAIAHVVAERSRVVSQELQLAPPRHRPVVPKALTENIELLQKSLAESSTAIMRHANQLREVTFQVVAKAQARAKQIVNEKEQRKHSRKAAKAGIGGRCGRKGRKCNR